MTDIEIPLGKRTPKYRFFEMLPGLLSYGIIILPIILSFISTVLAALFIIAYIIAWFVKSIGMAFRTIQGYNTMQRAQKVSWRRRLDDLEDPAASLSDFSDNQWRSNAHKSNLHRLVEAPAYKPSYLYNVVIIATYNESMEVLEPTIESIIASDYDLKHLIVIIAYEERGGQQTEAIVTKLLKKYGSNFYHASSVKHPDGIPYEVKGKGGNITFTGRWLKNWLKAKKVKPEQIIVTTLDSDNRPHKSYFSYVTYEYITHPDRQFCAFQPIALYMNNIWDVPAPMRVLATGNSFWTIINSLRPHMLRNFASHSQPMTALIDTDFWSVRTVVEDGHQFWRSYFRYDGNYDVVPIYVPIYQDAVLADGYRKTLIAQFIQLRRWAYGASDIAYVADKGFRKNRTVPLGSLLAKFFRLVESHVSWASASIILAFGAWAPLFINPESSRSIVAHQLPNIASSLQQFALVGLFITIFLTMRLLPPRPERYKRQRNFFMLAQWVIMPITSAIYGTAAAFNAQTRLLLGKYLDQFDVTDKVVIKEKR